MNQEKSYRPDKGDIENAEEHMSEEQHALSSLREAASEIENDKQKRLEEIGLLMEETEGKIREYIELNKGKMEAGEINLIEYLQEIIELMERRKVQYAEWKRIHNFYVSE